MTSNADTRRPMTCARGRRLSINDSTAATAGWHRSATSTQEETMSFQAYLDNIEDKTGLTPRETGDFTDC